ncbi:hypothetical protein [Solidesulfovibrio sp.]
MPQSFFALFAGLLMAASLVVPIPARLAAPAAAQPAPAPPGEPAAGWPEPTAAPAPGQPAPAPDSPEVRRQVSGARALSATATCFYGPHIDQAQAKRLCGYQARGRLLDNAAAQFGSDPAVVRAGLTPPDLRAFADSILKPAVADEEVRVLHDGLAVRLTLRAETAPEAVAERLAAFAANPGLRAAARAETAGRDRQAGEARMAAVPFGADREFRAREMEHDMGQDAAFAERRIVPGMSIAQVKELLGNPATVKQAVIGPESYLCAGYGRIWIVFRDGAVNCLRSRLDYVRRYDTDCHCAGNYSTILKND